MLGFLSAAAGSFSSADKETALQALRKRSPACVLLPGEITDPPCDGAGTRVSCPALVCPTLRSAARLLRLRRPCQLHLIVGRLLVRALQRPCRDLSRESPFKRPTGSPRQLYRKSNQRK